jgi:hypothetical protein
LSTLNPGTFHTILWISCFFGEKNGRSRNMGPALVYEKNQLSLNRSPLFGWDLGCPV